MMTVLGILCLLYLFMWILRINKYFCVDSYYVDFILILWLVICFDVDISLSEVGSK
jgi:hypothetical protein